MTTWILLRGLARESRHWGGLPDDLRLRLPSGERVLALDLPGNGQRWRERSPVHVDGMVDAARQALAERNGPFVVVALSLGGMVALRWAARHPQELAGCVLLNTSLADFSPPWRRLRPGSWPALLRVLAARDAHAREAAILRLTSNTPPHPERLAQWARFARECPISRANALRQLTAAARFRADTGRPAVPLLLLASAGDRLVAPDCSRALAAAWDVPLRMHPWAGHDLALDDPAWVVEQSIAWRASLSSR